MADPHDSHEQRRGFWGCANIALATGFAAFAAISGIALIAGGLSRPSGPDPQGEVKAAAIGAVPAPATTPPALAPAPAAPGTPTPPAPAAPAPAAPAGDTVEVTIKPGLLNALTYDVTTIYARTGQKVKITFANQHPNSPMPHSLLVCKPGSRERMYATSDAMMSDIVNWTAKGFIPETPDMLHHTRLLNPGETQTIEFIAGPEKGDYPYLCTFPGHPRIMQGTLKVE